MGIFMDVSSGERPFFVGRQRMLGEILEKTRKSGPLVHCMVNLVTANDCANLALACGASPIMAEDLDEVEQVISSLYFFFFHGSFHDS